MKTTFVSFLAGIALLGLPGELSAAPAKKLAKSDGALTMEQKKALERLTGIEYPPFDRDLFAYCERVLPPAVVRTVSVEGFAVERPCSTVERCAARVLNSGYRFVEFEAPTMAPVSFPGMLSGAKYRAVAARSSDPRCAPWNTYVSSMSDIQRQRALQQLPGQCPILTRIPEFTARYVIRDVRRTDFNDSDAGLALFGEHAADRMTGEILGSRVGVNFFFRRDGTSVSVSCSNDGNLEANVLPPLGAPQ